MANDEIPEGASYTRRPAVIAEIESALPRPPATWVALANTPESRGGMSSEAMVHLVRRLRHEPDARRVFGQLALALDGRIAKVVQRWARGFDQVTTEEIALDVGRLVLELCIGDGSAQAADFLEASFSVGVKRHTLHAVEKRRRVPKPHAVAAALAKLERGERPVEGDGGPGGDPDPEDDRGDLGGDPRTDTAHDPERTLVAAEASARTPEAIRAALAHVKNPRHREAVVLHHLEGWPITDQDPYTETLCRHFGVSDRQIRTWIATAFAQMRKSLGGAS
jgi:DNA-directed RNA polymerase specialized sigma24 family protein